MSNEKEPTERIKYLNAFNKDQLIRMIVELQEEENKLAASDALVRELKQVMVLGYELVYLIDDHFRNVIASGEYAPSDVENHKKAKKFMRAYKKAENHLNPER